MSVLRCRKRRAGASRWPFLILLVGILIMPIMIPTPGAVVAGLGGLEEAESGESAEIAESAPVSAQATLSVMGIDCAGCHIIVRAAAKKASGVSKALIRPSRDMNELFVTVTYDTAHTDAETIATHVARETGYTVTVMPNPDAPPEAAE